MPASILFHGAVAIINESIPAFLSPRKQPTPKFPMPSKQPSCLHPFHAAIAHHSASIHVAARNSECPPNSMVEVIDLLRFRKK